ncbi:MAG: helix-hairpin-helix domain-containing protein [Rhodocyclaceae bacterium]|nr:helix-hairpin-helix domain-containing protein [Rhodocyclaceae bacterium]MBX3669045.1 helix-hairpin-helix domain-containing protein [Rhodocyclaceae bacterium]
MGTNEQFGGVAATCAALGIEHGYAIHGDYVELNAQVFVAGAGADELSLQLWALAAPYAGGTLEGVLVAHLNLTGEAHNGVLSAQGFVPAQLPAGNSDHAMALVLVDQCGCVLDHRNFEHRQSFCLPRFAGAVECALAGDTLQLRCGGVVNPRSEDNLSGSLRLEVWALEGAYLGGAFAGHALAGADVGVVAGASSTEPIELALPVATAPAGTQLVAMLREWTAQGYVTRDYARLPAIPVAQAEAPAAGPVEAAAPAAVEVTPVTAPVATAAPAASTSADTGVSVNRATAAELTAIKGLSKPLAAAIVAGRPYASLDDLLSVKGMGAKMLAKLRAQLSL